MLSGFLGREFGKHRKNYRTSCFGYISELVVKGQGRKIRLCCYRDKTALILMSLEINSVFYYKEKPQGADKIEGGCYW